MKQFLHQRPLFWVNLPVVPYRQAWDLQKQIVAGKQTGKLPDTLVLLEHEPVFTWGRWGKDQNLRVSRKFLKDRGIELIRCERGGDITFHGPGQLVGYPILDLKKGNLGVKAYVNRLEETLLRSLKDFGLEASRREGFPGVWAEEEKIASIGIAVRRGTSFHGFALNYACDLSRFELITPCGLEGVRMTSMKEFSGKAIAPSELRKALARHFAEVFQVDLIPLLEQEFQGLLDPAVENGAPSLDPGSRPAGAGLGRDDEKRLHLLLRMWGFKF